MNETEIGRNNGLWNKFISGDDNAYSSLYKIFAGEMFDFGMHFTPNREMVKDCIQDVFIKIYSNRKGLTPVMNVRVYLFTALKNSLFDAFRKDVDHYLIDTIEPVFYVEYTVEKEFIESEILSEQRKRIAQMMDSVTPRQREVLYYRYVEELSYDEIGELMKMNYQSVRNLIHRSILKIRATFPDFSMIKLLFILFSGTATFL